MTTFNPAYAGFWRRVAASNFDYFFFIGWVLPFMVMMTGSRPLIALAAFIPVVILYFVALESSPLQATVGKLLMGIQVTNSEGERLSFPRSLARNVLKNILFSFFFGFLAFVTAALTEQKRAPPDMVVGALVIDRSDAGFLRGLVVFMSSFVVLALGIFVFWHSLFALMKNTEQTLKSWTGTEQPQEGVQPRLRPATAPAHVPETSPARAAPPAEPAARPAPAVPAVAPERPKQEAAAPVRAAPAVSAPSAKAAPALAPKRRQADDCVIKEVMTDEDIARCRR